MAKDIEREEPFGAGASRGHVPRHEHGTKVYPDETRSRKNYNVFLDAVRRQRLHMSSQFPGEVSLDRGVQELDRRRSY
jgi:hypothetical protein